MSKPKNKKSGSKSKKRIPARKFKPKCENCLTRPRRLEHKKAGP